MDKKEFTTASQEDCKSPVLRPLCQTKEALVMARRRKKFDRFVDGNVRGAQRRIYTDLRI